MPNRNKKRRYGFDTFGQIVEALLNEFDAGKTH